MTDGHKNTLHKMEKIILCEIVPMSIGIKIGRNHSRLATIRKQKRESANLCGCMCVNMIGYDRRYG